MRITLDHIKHFQSVVRFKNLNLAAKKTNISPSALSRSIKIIEEDYETNLFDRKGRNIILNDSGKIFYEKSLVLVEDYNSLLSNSLSGNIKGITKVGASHWLASKYLPKFLSEIQKENEKAKFEVFSYDSDISILKVLSGDLDFAICFSPKDHPDISSKAIHSGQLVLCSHSKHPLASLSSKKVLSEINNYEAIIHKPSELVFSCDDHPMFFKYDINPEFKFFWNSDHIAVELMSKSSYWTMIPDIIVKGESKLSKLKHPKDWDAPYKIKIIWHKDKKVRLIDELIEKIS